MAVTTAMSMHIGTVKLHSLASQNVSKSSISIFNTNTSKTFWSSLKFSSHNSPTYLFTRTFTSSAAKSKTLITKAMSEKSELKPLAGLPIDLKGKRAFIAGIADDNGYGWASLAAAVAEIVVGTWVPAMNIFETSLRRGKFDESRMLSDGSLMEITKVYPLDAVFDSLENVTDDVKANKHYAGYSRWTVKEVAESVKEDFGSIDILVHSIANGPEVTNPLLETSRNGYIAAISASSYSFVSLLKQFLPIMNPGGATITLTCMASKRVLPGK